MQTIALTPEIVAETPADLLRAVTTATDAQVAGKRIDDAEGQAEFGMSSDALGLQRLIWRLKEEWGDLDAVFVRQLKAQLCRTRRYDADDFESALVATRDRARLPFGWTALDLAWFRAKKTPIRLLHADVAGARLPTAIAGIALQLSLLQKEEPILLPIEPIRSLLVQRKVVVSGAVTRLLDAKLLEYAKEEYHTGSAREYKWLGKEGEHFMYERPVEDPEV